jgi:malonate-semialdehyde dehydrogenase (acetylating) / methylmalonate-semialdehyde dehydrogenase
MVAAQKKTVPLCRVCVAGEWREAQHTTRSPVYNPSAGEVIAETPMCGADEVSAAVVAAATAFADWKETPAMERAHVLFRFKMLLGEKFEEIARCTTREHGKTLTESRAELRRGIEIVEFACGAASLLSGESLENIARGVDCETVRQPLGVCVGLTPFNFPAMIPLWMYPVALACGNTFVLKPSEKVPLTAIMIAQLLEEAGAPAGVFNIVHGGRECRRSACAPDSPCRFIRRINARRATCLRDRYRAR